MSEIAPRSPRRTGQVLTLAVVTLVALTAVWAVWRARPLLTQDEVRSAVLTTLARESPEEFVVVGRLTSGLTTESARRWRVRVLDLEAGRATVTVALPGEVTYGFPLGALGADDIRYLDGRVVEVRMPPLEVFAVEAVLEEAVVESRVSGAARVTPGLSAEALQTALRRVRPALRQQAEGHLTTSRQPRQNAAVALRAMLAPSLEAAGVPDARFRFILAPGDTLEIGPAGRRETLAP